VVFVHEDAGRAREIVAPAIAYQRTRYAEWGTDRDKPKPAPISPEIYRGSGTSSEPRTR
jgi:hypothetical protein